VASRNYPRNDSSLSRIDVSYCTLIMTVSRNGPKKADELNKHGFTIKVSQFVANHATEPTDDICDILMRERKPITADLSEDNTQDDKVITVEISPKQRILNDMIASNPAIGTLVSNLNLQIV
jgi:hypothetical protein